MTRIIRTAIVLYLLFVGTLAGRKLFQERDQDRELDSMKAQAVYNLKILELRAGVHCDGS
jgi:hypothetical protein